MGGTELLKEYEMLCKRLDSAIAYNDTVKAFKDGSKAMEELHRVIYRLAEVEANIKGIDIKELEGEATWRNSKVVLEKI